MDLNFKRTAAQLSCFALVALLAAAFSSCETLVGVVPESRIGKVESKLVVHGYLSPADTLIRVFVTQTNPAFSSGAPGRAVVVQQAEVMLRDAAREVRLVYDTLTLSYTVPANAIGGVQPGNTYYLEVKDSTRSVSAATTIPSAPPAIASYRVDTSYTSGGTSFNRRDTTLAVQFTWKDPGGEDNYYRVAGKALILTDYIESGPDGKPVFKRSRASLPLYWDNSYGRNEFQSDATEDGAVMQSPRGRVSLRRASFYNENGIQYAEQPTEVMLVTLHLLHTDEAYYRYHRTARENDEAADNPFAEPVLLYTNVEGGLGVFASYHSFSIDIKP